MRTDSSWAVNPSVLAINAHASPISLNPCLDIEMIDDFFKKLSTLRGE